MIAQKMEFGIKDFLSKIDQNQSFLQTSHIN